MDATPKGLRLHIGIFGRRNVGKSSLMNALLSQEVAIVSAVAGTTTDPVEKSVELAPLGPVVFVDTAGIDDVGALGELRRQKTLATLRRVDLAILITDDNGIGAFETNLRDELERENIPFFIVFNKSDLGQPAQELVQTLSAANILCLRTAATTALGIDQVKQALIEIAPAPRIDDARLIGDYLQPGDLALLVVPIDLGAPKGRLILPQVQTLRDILDSDAYAMIVKERELAQALQRLNAPPRLVICDSQVVLKAAADTPDAIALTTFSILMSRFKGDILGLAAGAAAIHRLRPGSRVLIAEACTHHALADDIGRVKIPRWLRQFAGGAIETELVAGRDFPDDLAAYDLIIQCGGCMVTRREVLRRQRQAHSQRVPMTNYGMAISVLQGVLPRTLGLFPAALQAYRQGMEAHERPA